jgi:O-antigen ligase
MSRSRESLVGSIPLVAFVGLLAAGGALVISRTTPAVGLGAGLLLAVLIASFVNTELALHVILLSMLLSPEIVVGSVAGISIGKPAVKADVLVLRIEDLILTVVTFAWLARTAMFKELGMIRRTSLNMPMVTYIVAMVLATLVGVFFGTVRPLKGFFYTLKYVEYYVVFFMTVNYIHEERQLKRLLGTAFTTCAISAIMGILKIPAGERLGAPFEGQYGEPNTFGGYLVFMLALVLGCALAAREPMPALGWLAFAGLITLPLLFTLSRSSWLAAVPMLLTLAALSARRLLLMAGLGILVLLAPLSLPKLVIDRYNYTLNEKVDRGDYRIGTSRLDSSTSARLDSWKAATAAWAERPFTGYGVGGFGFIDAQYFRVLVEGGLLGLSAFIWLLWRLVHSGWTALNALKGSRYAGLPLGYLAGLVAMIIHAVGANTFVIVRIMEPFWFLTGIITILPSLVTASCDRTTATP